jgi:PAS domain S-box-containing protein
MPVYYKDVKGIYQGCNQRFADLVGSTKKEIIGMTLFDTKSISLEEAQKYSQHDKELIENPGIQTYEIQIETINGLRNFLCNKAPYFKNGEVQGIVGVLLDITEQKKAQQLKEEMEAIARHDLKTPLSGIKGVVQYLRMTGDFDQEQLKMLDLLEHMAGRMQNIVNLSLNIRKLEDNSYKLETDDFDLIPLLDKIFYELNELMEQKKVTPLICLDDEMNENAREFILRGEERLCYSMFTNLIKNAFEASPEDETVIINLSNKNIPEIEIINKGIVPAEIRDKFFEKYITMNKKAGTGLGTYSAKLIAETHGGDISLHAHNEENETRIRLRLPRNK